jgi:hypothetical protein
MATERLAGYEQLVGRWDATQHRAALADGRHAYFVARRQSEAIGFAIVRDWSSPEQVAHIKRIAVCRPGLGQGRSFLALLVERIFTDTSFSDLAERVSRRYSGAPLIRSCRFPG